VKKSIYTIFCVLGTFIPYAIFAPFLLQHGLDIPLLAREMFATPTSAFFTADIVISSLVLWVFIYFETRKRAIKYWWLAILANLTVGVSLALPLFLLLREVSAES
jgi:hypothetical protein